MSGKEADPLAATAPRALREYSFLADGERGVLVGPRGDFAWMCFPHWDDDAVFASLLGGRGTYIVSPHGRFVWGGSYEPASLIWRSCWTSDSGTIVESREGLALPSQPGRAVLLRRLRVRPEASPGRRLDRQARGRPPRLASRCCGQAVRRCRCWS